MSSTWQTERRWLGYAGLVPFAGCCAVLVFAVPVE